MIKFAEGFRFPDMAEDPDSLWLERQQTAKDLLPPAPADLQNIRTLTQAQVETIQCKGAIKTALTAREQEEVDWKIHMDELREQHEFAEKSVTDYPEVWAAYFEEEHEALEEMGVVALTAPPSTRDMVRMQRRQKLKHDRMHR